MAPLREAAPQRGVGLAGTLIAVGVGVLRPARLVAGPGAAVAVTQVDGREGPLASRLARPVVRALELQKAHDVGAIARRTASVITSVRPARQIPHGGAVVAGDPSRVSYASSLGRGHFFSE